jgi:hypothetical protein
MAATVSGLDLPFNEGGGDEKRAAEVEGLNAGSAATLGAADAAPLDPSGKDAATARAAKRKSKRLLVACLLGALLLLVLAVAGVFVVRAMVPKQEPTVKVGAPENQTGGGGAGQGQSGAGEDKYQAALDLVAKKFGAAGSGDGAGAAGAGTHDGEPEKEGGEVREEQPVGDGGTRLSDVGGMRSETVAGGGQPQRQEGQPSGGSPSGVQPNQSVSPGVLTLASSAAGSSSLSHVSARSVQHTARPEQGAETVVRAAPSSGGGGSAAAGAATGPSLPPFGAMVPVRSLGAIYTLRSSGGVVRFEVPYDKGGKGWFMPKGTEIVGVVRGSDGDRAFITMTGFIDPASGKLVRLTGDMLGGDGASGIRGQKKRVTSRWSRFLSGLRDAGVGALGALATGVGRGPIIISDVYRGGGGVASELSGLLGGGDGDSFVVLKAGVTGFAYVTQMPDEIQGLGQLANLPSDALKSISDPSARRQATGLGEDELAELLTSGDTEKILQALPRMTPEMRRVAQAFLIDGAVR